MKFFLVLIFIHNVYANINTKYSLRRFVQLPILGEIKGVESFEVYQRIEEYLKGSTWCYYKSNSEALSILQKHRPNLDLYLENSKFLSNIADKTKSGSLIRTKIHSVVGGVGLAMEVVGDNGQDVFFSEKILMENYSADIISQSIINWLNIYEKMIPYDGRVLGSLGRQFTIDIGEASNLSVGRELKVERPTAKRRHPLLEEIVGWKTEPLGMGKVVNSSMFQSQAVATKFLTPQPFQPGDWVVLEKKLNKKPRPVANTQGAKAQNLGQLGTLSVGLKLGLGNDTTTTYDFDNGQRVVGLLSGLNFNGELWVTKNYLAILDLERNVGSYQTSGDGGLSSIGVVQDIFKFKLGHRFLPQGSFWGPRVDIYFGYGGYNYDLDIVVDQGFGHHKVKGMLLGVKVGHPFGDLFRGFIRADFLPFASYEEETNIFGRAKSVTSHQLELGSSYRYSPQMSINGSFETTSNKAKFEDNNSFNFSDLAVKAGVIFVY